MVDPVNRSRERAQTKRPKRRVAWSQGMRLFGSVYSRMVLLFVVMAVALFTLGGLAKGLQLPALWLVFVVFFGFCGWLSTRMKCPGCKWPVALREKKAPWGRLRYWGFPPRKCTRCGHDFAVPAETSGSGKLARP